MKRKKHNIKSLQYKKNNKEIVTCLTAYDYRMAQLIDQSDIDCILVGDSVSNVIMGYDHTQNIGMTEILHHLKAVKNGTKYSLIIADMPFGSYQASHEKAIENACLLVQNGAEAIKIEGGSEYHCSLIEKLNIHGIPCIGHLGYTPQSSHNIGIGHKQGKTAQQADLIKQQSLNLEKAGAKAIVLELIPSDLAAEISQNLTIPTIGIGAGSGCDGQILVSQDILGLSEHNFSFVKKYCNLSEIILKAIQQYKEEVENQTFPEN